MVGLAIRALHQSSKVTIHSCSKTASLLLISTTRSKNISNGGEDVEDGSNRSFHCNGDSSPYTVLAALLDVCWTQICI